jgi:signal transduction histidine kinase/ActR/RegA family two-component response regulator
MTGMDQLSGLVMASDKEQGEFDEADEVALRGLATLAALALHHLEAHDEARTRAAESARAVAAYERADAALRDADRRKDEFLALLAHELRNPLAPLLSATQILQRAPLSPARDEALEIIKRQVWHMVRLIDDLVDVSSIAQGRVRLRKQQVDLALIIENAVAAVRPLVDVRGHHLEVSLPEAPALLDADPTRLTQVLSNLLDNAAKYTAREGKIWLSAAVAGGRAVVHVRDTGVGIAPAARHRVFQMFSREEHSLPGASGGLGVGLALARRLAELHGGTLELASSDEGNGSDFVVTLPLVEPAAPIPPVAEASVALPVDLHILVVDDNIDAARSLGSLLRLMGFPVEIAHDAAGALRSAATCPPAVALLDLGMPDTDGYEVARRLRAQFPPDELLLIAVTGWTQDQHRQRANEAGFDHHLAKPVDPAELRELLERFWERRNLARR